MAQTSSQLNSSPDLQENSTEENIMNPRKRSSTYYFEDDPMAIFLVEGCLFKVHRHYLVKGSDVFSNMFAFPVEEGKRPEGMTDDRPILLPEVTVEEFEALLNYFYLPSHTQGDMQTSNRKLYLDLLSISHRYFFDGIIRFSLKRLQPMISQIPISQRIILGDKYGIKEWLFSAYEELLDRTETLTVGEAKLLGFERVIRYLQARDASYRDRLEAQNKDSQRARGRYMYDHPVFVARSSKTLVEVYFSKT